MSSLTARSSPSPLTLLHLKCLLKRPLLYRSCWRPNSAKDVASSKFMLRLSLHHDVYCTGWSDEVRQKYRRVDCTAWRGAFLGADDSWRRVLRAIICRLTCNDPACGAVGVASGLQHDNRRIVVRFATRSKRFTSSVNAWIVYRIHSASDYWVPGLLPWGGYTDRRGKLTCHFCLVPRLTVSGSIPPLPNTSSWHAPYLYFNVFRNIELCTFFPFKV